MKTLIGVVAAIALVTAGILAWARLVAPRQKEAPVEIADPEPMGEPRLIPIPETTITLRHALQWKDSDGNPGLVLEAGAQLITESTQGLDYVVSRDGRTFRIHCDDAYESHGRFTNGQMEQLALQLAAEIRAEGKAPTNERIASRAQDALEQRRLDPSFTDPAALVDSLQRALLFHPPVDPDGEIPTPPAGTSTGKPD